MRRSEKKTSSGKTDKMFFVSGLPSSASSSSIITYFQQFGEVRLHRLGQKKFVSNRLNHRSEASTYGGFCVIEALNHQTFDLIEMSRHSLVFQGRSIVLTKYRQGAELYQHSDLLTSRKIILKKVPAQTDPQALQDFFEKNFGVIIRMFKFQAESFSKSIHKQLKRNFHSYSVEFQEQEAAQKAAEIRNLVIRLAGGDMISIIVEKYQKKQVHKGETKNAQTKKDFKKNKESSFRAPPQNLHFSEKAISAWTKQPQRKMVIDDHHYLKPTSRQYFAGRMSPIDMNSQLRFNIVARGGNHYQRFPNDPENPNLALKSTTTLVGRPFAATSGSIAERVDFRLS